MEAQNTINHLIRLLDDIKKEISNRIEEMDNSEAKIVLDDLNLIFKRYVDSDMKVDPLYAHLQKYKNQDFYPKINNLRIKMAKIIARNSLKSAAEIKPTILYRQTIQPASTSDSNLNLLIQKQNLLIKQIEWIKVTDNVCPVKAQVLYDHVEKLYEWFISNQAEIDTQFDGTALSEQQTIAAQTQQKVLDTQTGLKKIITTNTQMANAIKESGSINQKIAGLSLTASFADPNQISRAGPSERKSELPVIQLETEMNDMKLEMDNLRSEMDGVWSSIDGVYLRIQEIIASNRTY